MSGETAPPSRPSAARPRWFAWAPWAIGALALLGVIAGFLLGLARERSKRAVVAQQIDLLNQERKTLDNELNEYVLKPMSEAELRLGGREGGPPYLYDLKKKILENLVDEKLRISGQVAADLARLDHLQNDSAEGRTPGEVDVQVLNTPRYQDLMRRVDEAAARLDDLKATLPPDAKPGAEYATNSKAIDEATRRKAAAEARLDEVRESLRATYLAEMIGRLQGRIREQRANQERIEELISATSKEIGDLGQALNEYHWLQVKEQHMRNRLEAVQDRINHLRQYGMEDVPDPDPPPASPWASP